MTDSATRLAVTGWGVISSIGIGQQAFTEGVLAGRCGLTEFQGTYASPLPMQQAGIIPQFEITAFLGKKGTRLMDRTTGLAVASARMALESCNIHDCATVPDMGVVLGTSTGSIKSIVDFNRATFEQERPYLVNPSEFPSTVMNCAASQIAIWHKIKGSNITIAGGHLSGFLALRYAWLAIKRGYAKIMLTGCVEEFNEYIAWAYYHNRSKAWWHNNFIGEGSVMFTVENNLAASKEGHSFCELAGCSVISVNTRNDVHNGQQADVLAQAIAKLLINENISTHDIFLVSTSQSDTNALGQSENNAISMALPELDQQYIFSIRKLTGDCFSASMGMQLSAALAIATKYSNSDKKYFLLTAVTNDGPVACALFRNVRGQQ